MTFCYTAGCRQINMVKKDHIECDVCLGVFCIECKVNFWLLRWDITLLWLASRLDLVAIRFSRSICSRTIFANAPTKNAKFLWIELTAASGSLAVGATRVCVSSASLTKWLRTMTTMHVTSIWTMFTEVIGDCALIQIS